ncbi:hypothetical protein LCGC14_0479490 [marine sediment metagenome]|uniref:3'-phosphate/5'-hydroxy nucleic acid ligase n=1 Tax=marine sediment metagenome TaxID=412755 RepID=A0A0F9VIG0_9ZZZZ
MSNYNVMYDAGQRVPVKLWTKGVSVEEGALQQLRNVASLPFVYKHVSAMPDVHAGMGATIGSVVATDGAVVPSIVGVDIGCGMCAQKIDLTRDYLPKLSELRAKIERAVPHGRSDNGGENDRGRWGNIPEDVAATWDKDLRLGYESIIERHPAIGQSNSDVHLGTLGTGNHFIEICLDLDDQVWIMLHSGSRGIGGKIGSYFIRKAKEQMKKWFISLPDPNLAYFPQGTEYFGHYIAAANWAQKFAAVNRSIMMRNVICALEEAVGFVPLDGDEVNCHHNYLSRERHFGKDVWITRKGAVSANKGEMGIIPGSMGAKSFIVRGLGDRNSFTSCSHGAGRAMSRTAAKKKFSVEDHIRATEGIECRKDADVVDETPGAYKNIDDVMGAQKDLVEVVHQLRQVICVKG